jgi:hypothetical protein
VQAEFARYVVVSGDTYLRALNRIPGRLPGPNGKVSWTIWMGLLSFVPGVMGMGGILGGAGQALTLLMPEIDSFAASAIIAVVTSAILYTGSYARLERTMLVLVAGFTMASLVSVFAMQSTEYRFSLNDVARGLEFRFPAGYLVSALAVYGATGVNSAEISTYSYWCIEKGYPSFIGGDSADPSRLERARGWIKVLQSDIWVTLVILTCATLPFYFLGAAVLHTAGQQPQGLDTVPVLSGMFTRTLGDWSLWLFGGAAFCILFSSVVAGFGGTGRFLPDFLIEFGFLDRANLAARQAWIRAYGAIMPIAGFLFYLKFKNPLVLLSIGALMGALLLPVQSGATLWLHKRRMDPRIRPTLPAYFFLWLIFIIQLLMAYLVIAYVVL